MVFIIHAPKTQGQVKIEIKIINIYQENANEITVKSIILISEKIDLSRMDLAYLYREKCQFSRNIQKC